MNAPNRNLAIIRYIRNQNHTVTEASRHFKISRQWIYTLLNRYDEGGEEAVKPRSKAPKANPQAIPEALRKDIVNMRKQLTKSGLDAGPDTIASYLAREGQRVPSTSTIRRIITDAGLVTPQPQKRPRSSYIRFEASMPNECWQADITNYHLADNTRVEILDFIDDHSRYLLYLTARAAYTGTQVAQALQKLIDTYGPPASTLTDNGLVFTARLAGAKGGRNRFEVLLNTHHIVQKNGRPGHPQSQGKIERYHQTMKKGLKQRPPASSIEELQTLLDEWRHHYNHIRPHSAIKSNTPYEAYNALPKATPGDIEQDEWRIRTDIVDKAGRVCIRYAGRQYHLGIGRGYTGTRVDMVIVDKHVITSKQETNEVLTEHVIDVSRNYQKPLWKT